MSTCGTSGSDLHLLQLFCCTLQVAEECRQAGSPEVEVFLVSLGVLPMVVQG